MGHSTLFILGISSWQTTLAEHSALHEVWLVVTPQNPFKEKQSLLDNHLRLEMAELAVDDYPKLRTCNIEFHLPQPNYTVNTLAHLGEKISLC